MGGSGCTLELGYVHIFHKRKAHAMRRAGGHRVLTYWTYGGQASTKTPKPDLHAASCCGVVGCSLVLVQSTARNTVHSHCRLTIKDTSRWRLKVLQLFCTLCISCMSNAAPPSYSNDAKGRAQARNSNRCDALCSEMRMLHLVLQTCCPCPTVRGEWQGGVVVVVAVEAVES